MFIEPTLKDFNKTFFAFFEGEREDWIWSIAPLILCNMSMFKTSKCDQVVALPLQRQ